MTADNLLCIALGAVSHWAICVALLKPSVTIDDGAEAIGRKLIDNARKVIFRAKFLGSGCESQATGVLKIDGTTVKVHMVVDGADAVEGVGG